MTPPILRLIKPWVIVALYVAIIFLCVVGNGLVLYVITFKNHMKNVTNCFIGSLTISDLLIGLVVVTLATVQTVNAGLIHGSACKMPVYFESVCCTASIYSLLAVSFDRYRAVIHPTKTALTLRTAVFVVFGVWIWSFFWASKVFILFFVIDQQNNDHDVAAVNSTIVDDDGDVDDEDDGFCSLLVEEESDDFWFRLADVVILFVLPFVLMLYMYIRISRHLWFSDLAMNSSLQHKRNVVKFLIFDVILFFFSWAPFYFMDIITDGLKAMAGWTEERGEELENSAPYVILRFLFIIFAFSNSFLNPILYIFFNQYLRMEIIAIFIRKKARIGPSTGPSTIEGSKSFANNAANGGTTSHTGSC